MKIITHDLSKDFKQIKLLVLSDLHLGEALVDKNRLNEFIQEAKQDNCFVIVNGDLVNNAIRDSVSDIYEEKLTPNEQIDKLVELLYPIKDKILTITEGNHERRTKKQSGILLLDRASKELYGHKEAQNIYSSGAYLTFISFGKNKGRGCRKTTYSFYGKHGTGGGKKVGSKANRLEDMLNTVNADIFLHSHTHTPISFRLGSFNIDYKNKLASPKEHLFVNSSAFLKFGGYGEELGFRPASTVYPKIYLEGNKRQARCLI